jgi:hypothetical protein
MAEAVYALCAATSIVCAVLLLRGYRESRTKLLLWSGLCFAGLALNNVLSFVDLAMVPARDFGTLRSGVALAAMMVLLFGLIWERP